MEKEKETIVVEVDGKEIAKANTPTDEKPKEVEKQEVEKPKEEKSYTQIRTERAARQAEENLLKELGVESIEEAKTRLADGKEALKIATEVKATVDAENDARLKANIVAQLKDLYKGTFDPDVLVQLTDLDAVELDDNGKMTNGESLLTTAKEQRPHFFGVQTTKSDSVATNTGTSAAKDPMTQAYEDGDYTTAVKEHLKIIKHGG